MIVGTLQIKYISTNSKYFCLQTYSTPIIIIIIIITSVALKDRQHFSSSIDIFNIIVQGEYKLSEDFAKQYFHKY
jgi:hypothetical protein